MELVKMLDGVKKSKKNAQRRLDTAAGNHHRSPTQATFDRLEEATREWEGECANVEEAERILRVCKEGAAGDEDA